MAEFQNWDVARIASTRLTTKWNYVGFYTLMNAEEIEAFAKSYGIFKPYQLLYMINSGYLQDEKMKTFIKDLREQTYAITKDSIVFNLAPAGVLDQAFIANKKKMLYEQSHGKLTANSSSIGIGCNKVNCCQKK